MDTLRKFILRGIMLYDIIFGVLSMESVVNSNDKSNELSRPDLVVLLQNKQYFQDIFSEQPTPLEIMFGHVCENPKEWEQQYQKRDMANGRYQGKVRWGNSNGGYGEHYWDFNHRK